MDGSAAALSVMTSPSRRKTEPGGSSASWIEKPRWVSAATARAIGGARVPSGQAKRSAARSTASM